jgi:hypothetical protein
VSPNSPNGGDARTVIEVFRKLQHGGVQAPQPLFSAELLNDGVVIESAIAARRDPA